MANVNRQQRMGCLRPRASLLLCKPFVSGRLRPRAKPASQLTRAAVYQGHRNIPGNVMRWRKSSLSDLPLWGCITGYNWKDNLISCLMPILKGQSRSRELLAGLCKLGGRSKSLKTMGTSHHAPVSLQHSPPGCIWPEFQQMLGRLLTSTS